jgi:hypothetical protein
MHTVYRLCTVLVLLVAAFAGTVAQAAVTTFNNRAAWQTAAGTATTIAFDTKDDGTPITDPPVDVVFASLTLKGVTFLDARSYLNQFLYTATQAVIRVNLPANTTAFGVDLTNLFDDPGSYIVRLSTGEVLSAPAGISFGFPDFFGVTSTTPIQWAEFSLNSSFLGFDNFSFVGPPLTQQVRIDIKPSASNDINPVNPDANGVIPVAIVSSSTFDALQVYIPSVRFGRAGTEAPIVTHSYQDTNGDGRLDLVMQFRTQATGIQCGDTTAKLSGQTTGGTQLTGSDVIRTVGCK